MSASWNGSGGIFDIGSKDKEIVALQTRMSDTSFWQDAQAANQVVLKLKALKNIADPWHKHEARIKELKEFFELSEGENADFLQTLSTDIEDLDRALKSLEFYTLFNGEFDKNNAILSVNAGAGGTESCDWASMLLRMYTRWAQMHGFDVTVIDILPGEEAGIKNVTAIIKGAYAYGYLRPEMGVHRLVRISPFDSNKRPHTRLPPSTLSPRSSRTSTLRSSPTISRSMCSAPAARAASTSTPRIRPCASRICRAAS